MVHPASRHLSLIDLVVTDDFIERRTKAATAIATRWRRLPNSVVALDKAGALADALVNTSAGGPVPASLRREVGGDIYRYAPTHNAGDAAHDFEVATVAGVGAIMALDSTAARSDSCSVFAEALSAAMDLANAKAPPRVADFWNDLARVARAQGDGAAERRRERQPINTADPAIAVAALAENSAKDAEEIDILWWTLNDWSTLADGRLSGLTAAEGAVAAAIELASLLNWPAVRAHRQLAHRNVADYAAPLALDQLGIEKTPFRARTNIALAPLAPTLVSYPRVFVALTAAMASSPLDADAALNAAGIDPQQSRPAWQWCERLVRELSLATAVAGKLGPLE